MHLIEVFLPESYWTTKILTLFFESQYLQYDHDSLSFIALKKIPKVLIWSIPKSSIWISCRISKGLLSKNTELSKGHSRPAHAVVTTPYNKILWTHCFWTLIFLPTFVFICYRQLPQEDTPEKTENTLWSVNCLSLLTAYCGRVYPHTVQNKDTTTPCVRRSPERKPSTLNHSHW